MSDPLSAPELKDIPAQRVISMEHKGAYEEIGDVHRRLAAWATERGVRVAGKGRTYFLDAPREGIPEAARYMVCLPVEGDVEGDEDVKVQNLPAKKVYAYQHQGPYSQIPAKYAELMAWVSVQQYQVVGPPFEVYLKAPRADGGVAPEECLTEICLPVDA